MLPHPAVTAPRSNSRSRWPVVPGRLRSGAFAIAMAACSLFSGNALAADAAYPARPVRLVLGFPPGGTSDFLARAIGDHLAANLGQNVVIDNRPGAAGNIAAELVAKAPPNGYTLFLSSGSTTVSPSLYRNLAYDFQRDFLQLTRVADVPFLLAVYAQLPARNVQELLAHVRARPREINFASSGIGTPSHLASELFKLMGALEVTHVPYKGTVPAMVDLISGRVQFYFTSFPGALAHVRAGRVRALAVSSDKRSAALPELPTLDESGLKGYRGGSWYGLAFPRGVAMPVANRVHAIVQTGIASPELKAKLVDQGLDVVEGLSPEAMARFVREDIARWADVVRRANVTLN